VQSHDFRVIGAGEARLTADTVRWRAGPAPPWTEAVRLASSLSGLPLACEDG
jgi:hypothetical protein